jgi:hypothetical protein
MTFDDLGNLGEFVAAIGVIVSLVYVAIQVRQNTRALRSSAIRELQAEVRQNAFALANDEALARIWRQANEDLGRLTEDERIRFFSLAMCQFSSYENLFFQHQSSTIDEETWQDFCKGMRFALSHPGYRSYWANMRSIYSSRFQSFVERELLHGRSESEQITAYKKEAAGSGAPQKEWK